MHAVDSLVHKTNETNIPYILITYSGLKDGINVTEVE